MRSARPRARRPVLDVRAGPGPRPRGGDRAVRGDRVELLYRRKRRRDRAGQRGDRPARPRLDAGHRHRRHRSVRRLAAGPVRRRARGARARRGLADRGRRGGGGRRWDRRRRTERAARRAARHPAAHRHPRHVLALPRRGRGRHRGRAELARLPGVVPGPGAGEDRRRAQPARGAGGGRDRLLADDPSDGGWADAEGDRVLSRRRALCRAAGGPAPGRRLPAVGAVRGGGGAALRRAPGPGEGRRRHRVRADGDHRRDPGRDLHLRRSGQRGRDAAGARDAGRPPERPAPGRPARRAGGGRHPGAAAGRARSKPNLPGEESHMSRAGLGLAMFASTLVVGVAACRGGAEHGQTIAMMPKNKGNPYFASCRTGAEEAAKELKARLLWDGPTETDPVKQNEVVEAWITRGVDVIAVSVENKEAISTVLRKARSRGIKVITLDADTEPDARDYFVNQATPRGIAETLAGHAARLLGGKGSFAVITASLTAANQNEWLRQLRLVLAERYPDMKLVDVRPSDDDRKRAFEETQTLLKVHPEVKVVMAIASPAVPGAAEAVKQSGRTDVPGTGLGPPDASRPYLKEGVLDSGVLSDTTDLGYLTI